MNKKQEEQFDKEFGEESGIYYGKDIDGDRIFIPNGALEPIKQFISNLLKEEQKEIIELIEKKETTTEVGTFKDGHDCLKKQILYYLKIK